MKYDVVIIGAGPAGLFAAHELAKHKKNLKIAVIEKGREVDKRKCPLTLPKVETSCLNCATCSILSGEGGAGLFSDGKLNLIPKLGKTDLYEFLSAADANSLIDYIDEVFVKFGVTKTSYPKDMIEAERLRTVARDADVDFLPIKQKHVGSDRLPGVIKNFTEDLRKSGVKFMFNKPVTEILQKDEKVAGIQCNGDVIESEFVIAAPGRAGQDWVISQVKKLQVAVENRGIEVGVRIEVPASVMRKVTDIVYDPTFFIYTDTYDDLVRTFCTNPRGFVSKEKYDAFVCVNGYASTNKLSSNTNFALLSNVKLEEPDEDTIAYGRLIGLLASNIGGGKPLLQRMADLRNGRRSTWERIRRSYVSPTLPDVTPGDLSMALPRRILVNIIEGLEKLDKVIPGVANDSTLLYAPEIKFFSVRVKTNKNLETSCGNLFVAGDGVGVCGNIIGAAATGVIAARGILKKMKP